MNDLLFVYGTLLTADNEFSHYLKSNANFYCSGKFKGLLYDIGEYPGAIADPAVNIYVYGDIYEIKYASKLLSLLDEYEGISINDPMPHEYTRQNIDIETDNGILNCWIYLYNWPVNNCQLIVSGNYRLHKVL